MIRKKMVGLIGVKIITLFRSTNLYKNCDGAQQRFLNEQKYPWVVPQGMVKEPKMALLQNVGAIH
jgi:hypothetical protein